MLRGHLVFVCHASLLGQNIDLVLIDQQSVGKRSLHLMDTVNAKKRWATYLACQQSLERESQSDRPAIDRASCLKIKGIHDISCFGTPDCHHCCSIA
jgi:hypothetical protein